MTSPTIDAKRRLPLHHRIMIGLVLGAVVGIAVNLAVGDEDSSAKRAVDWVIFHITGPIGALFLRLLLMLVVPLVFSSLVVGIAGIGDIRKLGRLGLKAFLYTLVISGISVVIGLTMANTIKPGKRMSEETATELREKFGAGVPAAPDKAEAAKPTAPLKKVVDTLIPSNPFFSAATELPNMLHLMFFALLMGVGITLLPHDATRSLVSVLQGLFEVISKLIDLIMLTAPYAVACLVFNNTAQFGIELLAALSWYVVAVLGGLALHMFGVYSLSVYYLSGIPPLDFFRRTRTAALTAFSTSSSNATLPTAMKVTEENLHVPPEIGNFVLTVGATANQNGTALYEGVTVLFLAQLAGVDLTLGQQLMVAYMAILGGIGTAGVPSGSIPFVVLVLSTIGVQPELVAVILGIDRFLDMCRTTLNVTGDITAATFVAKSEGYKLAGDAEKNSS
ncbi:MAG: dicarboxylate/amino acid:cation symporter [Planctomycetia bacterium]|nr:dicarboxylate/amino acid:cation symporter [Planctomycetia bacterium]